MSEFVTILKSDKDFKEYMLGKVPGKENCVAVPVRGLNGELGKEQVTFQLIDQSQKKRPLFLQLSSQLIRWKWLTISMTPVLCAFFYLMYIGFQYSFFTVVLVSLTLFMCHSSIFILNDFYDHLFGIDSAGSRGGSRVIQKAWLSAGKVRLIGFVFLGFAIGFGLLLSYLYGWKLLLLGGLGLLSGWMYSYLTKFRRFIGLNILMITFFMGPFLTIGLSWGLSGYVNAQLIFMGVLFGLLAYLCIGFRHIENLYLSHKAAGTSFVEYLGFDRSKWFLLSLVLVIPFVYGALALSLVDGLKDSKLIFLVLPAVIYIFILRSTMQLNSGMGSSIVRLRGSVALLHFMTGLALSLYLLFKL